MKTTFSASVLALLAFSLAAPLRAAPETVAAIRSTPPSHPSSEIGIDSVIARVPANGDSVTRGTSRVMVSVRLGQPNGVLADGSWFYRGYTARPVRDAAENRRAGTLVVRFAAGKVVSLTLADEPTLVALRKPSPSVHPNRRLAAE